MDGFTGQQLNNFSYIPQSENLPPNPFPDNVGALHVGEEAEMLGQGPIPQNFQIPFWAQQQPQQQPQQLPGLNAPHVVRSNNPQLHYYGHGEETHFDPLQPSPDFAQTLNQTTATRPVASQSLPSSNFVSQSPYEESAEQVTSQQCQSSAQSQHLRRGISQGYGAGRVPKRRKAPDIKIKGKAPSPRGRVGGAIIRLAVDDSNAASAEFIAFYEFCNPFRGQDGSAILSIDDLRRFFVDIDPRGMRSTQTKRHTRRKISGSVLSDPPSTGVSGFSHGSESLDTGQRVAQRYRGYLKEFRLRDSNRNGVYKCTLGCPWSHDTKGNWERHERSHYPQEIWVCRHPDCAEKNDRTRVSLRKDLAKRHYKEHHQTSPTDLQIESCRIAVHKSLFPRQCVFDNCSKMFGTFDERLSHVEIHLRRREPFDNNNIVKWYGPDLTREPLEPYHEQETTVVGDGESHDDDNDDDGDSSSDGEEGDDEFSGFDDHWRDNNDEQDRDPGSGASGGGGRTVGSADIPTKSVNATGGWRNESGAYYHSGPGLSGYTANLDVLEHGPWKVSSALHLQILPHVTAYRISKIPIVPKKILLQLQAALASEPDGEKQAEIIDTLTRELSSMKSLLVQRPPSRSAPRGTPAAVTDASPLFAHSVRNSKSKVQLYRSRSNLDKLTRSGTPLHELTALPSSQETAEKSKNRGSIKEATSCYADQIYRGIPNPYSVNSGQDTWRPSRLLHVGSLAKPILHLDTWGELPSELRYSALGHCCDGYPGLQLTSANIPILRLSIPSEGLPTVFQKAVQCSREQGLEYLWIDSLCILQDVVEDWKSEGPKMGHIYASASFLMVVTTITRSTHFQRDETIESSEYLQNITVGSTRNVPFRPTHGSASGLTINVPVSRETDRASRETSPVGERSRKMCNTSMLKNKPRKLSHQIEVRPLRSI